MTTETSNARGDLLRPKLENIISGHRINADDADWLRGLLATAPPPAAARGDVLTSPEGDSFHGWAAWLRDRGRSFDPYIQGPMFEQLARWMESLPESALAAEGVQAGEVEQRVRRLQLDGGKYEVVRETWGETYALRHGERWRDLTGDHLFAHLFEAALSQQPAARGVVDALQRAAESAHVPPKVTETRGEYFKAGARAMLTAMNRELAALTGERNG